MRSIAAATSIEVPLPPSFEEVVKRVTESLAQDEEQKIEAALERLGWLSPAAGKEIRRIILEAQEELFSLGPVVDDHVSSARIDLGTVLAQYLPETT